MSKEMVIEKKGSAYPFLGEADTCFTCKSQIRLVESKHYACGKDCFIFNGVGIIRPEITRYEDHSEYCDKKEARRFARDPAPNIKFEDEGNPYVSREEELDPGSGEICESCPDLEVNHYCKHSPEVRLYEDEDGQEHCYKGVENESHMIDVTN